MKNLRKLFLFLAVVVFVTSSKTAYAGHKHSDSCYTTIYHNHTDSCYETIYHVHTEECHQITYHVHTDSCYTNQAVTSSRQCDGWAQGGWQENGTWLLSCSTCGYTFPSPYNGYSTSYVKCPRTYTSTGTQRVLTCTKTADTIDSDEIICGKDETTIESRNLICGKDETTIESRNLTCGQTEWEDPPTPAPAPQGPSVPATPAESLSAQTPETTAELEPESKPAEPEPKKEEKKPKEVKETEEAEETTPIEETEPDREIKPVEKPEPIVEPKIDMTEVVEIVDDETPAVPFQVAATVAGTSTATGGMIWIIFCFFYRKCKVIDTYTEQVIGKAYIGKRKNAYTVKISRKLQQGCGSQITLAFNRHFANKNGGKQLYVMIGDYEYHEKIGAAVDLTIKED